MSVHKQDSDHSFPTSEMNELFEAIATISTKEEAKNFLRDLLTIGELHEFANRWQIVLLLTEGQSYVEIAKTLNVSTTTVTRVAHWLRNGTGGYRTIVNRLKP